MNIFLVSQEAARGQQVRLAAYLSRLRLEPSLLTTVVVIDEREWGAPDEEGTLEVGCFRLDDFLHEKGRVSDGEVVVDSNVIGAKLGAVPESCLIIDFGLHEQAVARDFIRKLATFTFHFRSLDEKSIVLVMPSLHLGLTGRYVNNTFNSISITPSPNDRATRHRHLLLAAILEKPVFGPSSIAWPVFKAGQLARFFYERITRASARSRQDSVWEKRDEA